MTIFLHFRICTVYKKLNTLQKNMFRSHQFNVLRKLQLHISVVLIVQRQNIRGTSAGIALQLHAGL